MEREQPQKGPNEVSADAATRRFRERAGADLEERDDATLAVIGTLKVSSEEDLGSDPYNRKGRFTKIVC
jgi:hypothetical protein